MDRHVSDFASVSQQWVHFSLSVGPRSVRTFVDGKPALVDGGKLGFHMDFQDCQRNAAYPDPRHLNRALRGFAFGDLLAR